MKKIYSFRQAETNSDDEVVVVDDGIRLTLKKKRNINCLQMLTCPPCLTSNNLRKG